MLFRSLQYFGHLMRKADLFEKTLMLGKIEGRRKRGRQRIRWLDGITESTDMGWGGLRAYFLRKQTNKLRTASFPRGSAYLRFLSATWVKFDLLAFGRSVVQSSADSRYGKELASY